MFDWWSKKPVPSVLSEELPPELRIQCLKALEPAREIVAARTTPGFRALGDDHVDIFGAACEILREELGVAKLPHEPRRRPASVYGHPNQVLADEFVWFFQECTSPQALDGLSVVMKLLTEQTLKGNASHEHNDSTVAAKINSRFMEHGVGFQYQSGRFVCVKSTHIHSEAVEPALQLLADRRFAVANDEYRKAYENYRQGRLGECLIECSKSLESTLKVICDAKGWARKKTDAAGRLIEICIDNGLVAASMKEQLSSLRSLLGSGAPMLRNQQAAHGAGSTPHETPLSLCRYALHITAAALLLLLESFGESEGR